MNLVLEMSPGQRDSFFIFDTAEAHDFSEFRGGARTVATHSMVSVPY